MNAQEAAAVFYDWASSEGLVHNSPVAPNPPNAALVALITPLTDAGKQLLRAKQIQGVGFNEVRNELLVFTRRAAPGSRKHLAALPNAVDGVAVKYRQGVQHPIGITPGAPFGAAYSVRQTANGRFYACGSSISVGNCKEAGTLGCLVRGVDGTLYGLSNNHVSGSCSFAGVGLPILAPGVLDVAPGNLAPFTLGFHHAALAMAPGSPDNVDPLGNRDAAIFKIPQENVVSSFQGDAFDTPQTVGNMVVDMEVEKVGRTTGHTKGRIISQMHGPVAIDYRAEFFKGLVCYDPVFTIVGAGEMFSDEGDSGSLIVAVNADGTRTAVGLVVGGMEDASAPGGKTTMAIPVAPILQAFNVTLVGGHNI